MYCDVWDRLETGPVKALAAAWDQPEPESQGQEDALVTHLLSVIPQSSSREAWSDEVRESYRTATIELGLAFSLTQDLGALFTTWDALRVWPMRISDDFINLLSSWHPGALILLAHYCILLKRVEMH